MKDPDIKVFPYMESPEFKEYCELMRDWYKKGYIRSDIATVQDHGPDIKAGKYAVVTCSNLKPGVEAEWLNGWNYEPVIIRTSESILMTSSIRSTLTAISRNSPNKERATMFIEMMNTDKELYNLMVFGMENKHYKKIAENRVEPVKDSTYSAPAWLLGNQFNAYLLPGQADDVWQQTIDLNSNALPSPILGFDANLEPITNEIANCNAVHDEFYKSLTEGAVETSEILPKFIDKMKEAGLPKIVEELQKQIDEWKAMK